MLSLLLVVCLCDGVDIMCGNVGSVHYCHRCRVFLLLLLVLPLIMLLSLVLMVGDVADWCSVVGVTVVGVALHIDSFVVMCDLSFVDVGGVGVIVVILVDMFVVVFVLLIYWWRC